MPYIPRQRRQQLDGGLLPDGHIGVIPGDGLNGPGELAYVLQQVVKNYLIDHGRSFQTLSEIAGALACLKADFNDRVLIPYEREKCRVNGDVWYGC